MKKLFLSCLCTLAAFATQAQNVMVVEKNDNTTMKIYIDNIKSVYFEQNDIHEDVYTIGTADYSTPWWSDFSKYYQVADGETWMAEFDLHVNPASMTSWENFAMIITNDEDRGAANYREYGAIRFDHQPSGNSEWGDYIDRSYVSSTLTYDNEYSQGAQAFGGKVTLTVDRSNPDAFSVTITNGNVTKTYAQPYALPNLNANAANTSIRCFLVPEHCYIDFLASNIEPVGGYTSSADKQPVAMTLNGVPKKVLLGTTLDQTVVNITALVQFQENVKRTVNAADMQFSVQPDMTTPGTKTLTATYGKTYFGEPCDQPVTTTATFEVVENAYTTIGATDFTTPFWGAHSDAIKVKPNETFISTFTNYTSGKDNWNNFNLILHGTDSSEEYAVLRADNYGWGSGYDNNPNLQKSDGQQDWAAWLAAMDGAKVTAYVTNNGDGSADVYFDMKGNDGNDYIQYYNGIAIESDDLYFNFTVDGSYIEFSDQVGATDNSSAFWSLHSDMWNVPQGKTVTRRFRNFAGEKNWNNFIGVLTKADQTEYAVVRADNFGWGSGYDACTPSGTQGDWTEWLKAMDEAMCNVSVTNNGTSADIRCYMQGNNGVTYEQNYIGISPITADDLFFRFTIDNCHLVFE